MHVSDSCLSKLLKYTCFALLHDRCIRKLNVMEIVHWKFNESLTEFNMIFNSAHPIKKLSGVVQCQIRS